MQARLAELAGGGANLHAARALQACLCCVVSLSVSVLLCWTLGLARCVRVQYTSVCVCVRVQARLPPQLEVGRI